MAEALLPLFPLELVLLPRTALPLHIFEPRYKEMIGLCLEEPCQFGVVLSSGNGMLRTGCAAAIHRVLKRYEDGKLDILAYGTDRFEIISIDSERSYFRADVRYFDDDDTRPARMKAVHEAQQRGVEYARLLGEDAPTVDADDPRLSFILAGLSPDLNFRQMLLQMRSEADRMERVAEHLGQLIERHRRRDAIGRAARLNGHGKSLPEGNE